MIVLISSDFSNQINFPLISPVNLLELYSSSGQANLHSLLREIADKNYFI